MIPAAASMAALAGAGSAGLSLGGIGSLLGGVASLGGLFGSKGMSPRKQMMFQRDMQIELNRRNIQDRVYDAKQAGIHPLYAMGTQPVSFTPTVAGNGPSFGDRLSEVGQNVGRALQSHMTASERAQVAMENNLKLENMSLQNDLLRSQITSISRPTAPPMPGTPTFIDGQGDSSVVNLPLERVGSARGLPSVEPGAITDTGHVATGSGGLAPVPSQDAKQRIEDQIIPQLMWSYRNLLMPNLGLGTPPPFFCSS